MEETKRWAEGVAGFGRATPEELIARMQADLRPRPAEPTPAEPGPELTPGPRPNRRARRAAERAQRAQRRRVTK